MNSKNHSYDDIYFKHFLKTSHRRKIDIKTLLTLILTNAGMILIGFLLFLIISSDTISIKLNADDKDNNSYPKVAANNNQHTDTSYSTTSIASTEKTQETAVSTLTTESTVSDSIEENYGIVNTQNNPLNVRTLPSIESEILTKIPKGTEIRLCEKISVNLKTVIKNDIWEWLE